MEQTLAPAASAGTAHSTGSTAPGTGLAAPSHPAGDVGAPDAAVPAIPNPPDAPSGPPGAARAAADYVFDLPDHLTVDTEAADRFRALCAAQGLTPEQARAAVDFYVAEHEAAGGLAADGCEAGLRTLWKGRYDERIDAARRAVRSLDARMEGRLAPLVRAGLGNHPTFAELMALVGDRMGEDSLGAGSGPAGARGEAMSTEDFLRTVVFAKR
ncbi:hypothetical protein ACR4XJ_08045 [Nitratidesulfovibrio sp. D1]|uniref:hypothetical protein n=1 Tax=Nitratidesulfovibrio sp. D1 TaxID=3440151 RepID=UPI003EC05BB7